MNLKKIIFIIFFITLKFYNQSFASIDNKIIIKIENEIITNFEIKNKILSLLVLGNQEINQKNINILKRKALDSLIDLKLKRIALKNYNFKDDYNQINSYLNKISANNINSLKNSFAQNKVNYELFINELKTEFKWQKLIYSIYSDKIEINENSFEEELEQLIKNKKIIEEFELSEIEILIGDNIEKTNKKIASILENINKQGFEKTALNFSISSTANNKGYLGWIKDRTLNKDILKELNTLQIGQITKPLKKQDSILFLKLNNKRNLKSEQIDKKKLKNELINNKKNELFNLYSKSHISKLKNTSFIEYK